MSSELDTFIKKLKSEHDTLTKTFESTQAAQRAAREVNLKARDALVEFRSKYKGYLKLADEGSIVVTEK